MAYSSYGDEMRKNLERLVKDSAMAFQRVREVNLAINQRSDFYRTMADVLARQEEDRQRTFNFLCGATPPRWMHEQKRFAEVALQTQEQQEQIHRLLFSSSLDLARRVNEAYSQSLAQTIKQVAYASASLEQSLRQTFSRFDQIGLLEHRFDLAARLLQPQRTFVDFAEYTAHRLETSKSEQESKALETSLELAEVQLVATAETHSNIIVVPQDSDPIPGTTPLSLPFVQQEELLVLPGVLERDSAELTGSLSTAKVDELSRKLLRLVAECNEAAKVANGNEIFKPTTRLISVTADLPWLLPQDKESFATFVDYLYFIFYEGAGKDKLRFLVTNGGVLNDSDAVCNLLWCIKHLRNKWLRHDADHGNEADIKKSWQQLRAKFDWLGLGHHPISEAHFRQLHLSLLIRSVEFLETLLNKIAGGAP